MEGRPKVVRALKPGEAVPDSVPSRLVNGQYVVLQWRLGQDEYVRTYEHRVFDGRVTTAAHVHHVNGQKHDNRAENLVEMTRGDHARAHAVARGAWYAEAARLYVSGLSMAQVGKQMGRSGGSVKSALNAMGVKTRTISEAGLVRRGHGDLTAECIELYRSGLALKQVAEKVGLTWSAVRQTLIRAGEPRRRVGRPRKVSGAELELPG